MCEGLDGPGCVAVSLLALSFCELIYYMFKQITRASGTEKLNFDSPLNWVQDVAADLESWQPCSAWEPLLFPLHFPLYSGDTSILWLCCELVGKWPAWKSIFCRVSFHLKHFPSLTQQAAVQVTVSLLERERMEIQMCDGERVAAFHISAGSCWLTVFIALYPVKSSRSALTPYFKGT